MRPMVAVRHRHIQANVKQTMAAWKIRRDVSKVFAFNPDTIVFNEAGPVLRAEVARQAKLRGYGFRFGAGPYGQLGAVWKESRFEYRSGSVKRVSRGVSNVQPNRGVLTVTLRDLLAGGQTFLAGTHTIASGWTGKSFAGGVSDAWRRRKWHRHVKRMAGRLRTGYRHNARVIWSGDMNRPRNTWKGRPFGRFKIRGARTDLVVKTDGTHGRKVYDYVGALSKRDRIRVHRARTPAMYSDHDMVVVDFRWEK